MSRVDAAPIDLKRFQTSRAANMEATRFHIGINSAHRELFPY